MSDQTQGKPVGQQARDRLEQAYELMMGRVKHLMETAEERAKPTLERAVEQAREKAVELGEITRDEAQQIGEYLKRDMHDLAEYLNDTGDEIKDWLRIDLELIEGTLLDMIASVADRTRVELAGIAERAREATLWHTGEITAPGALACTECDERLHFTKAGHIPPCPKCHSTRFKRVRG